MFTRQQQKWILIILSIAVLILGCLTGLLGMACFYTPYHVTTSYLHLSSPSIPESMDQVSAVFITDLEYSDWTDSGMLDTVFSQIQSLDPDIFFFGGDLFASSAAPDDQSRKLLADKLSSIDAPLGKFAVFGEQDLVSEQRKSMVSEIYRQAQIEVLSNSSVLLTNQDREGIRLYGLDIQANPAALQNYDQSAGFSLLLSHYPDNMIPLSQTGLLPSYAFCGNSHGTQIDWPLAGGYKVFPGSEQINRAHTPSIGFPYTISSGLGCIDVPARINSPVQILFITFAIQ